MKFSILGLTLTLSLLHCCKADFDWDVITPLDDYVNRDDGFYHYEVVAVSPCTGYTLHLLNLTSQKWMDETVTTVPIWTHDLIIAIPDVIQYTNEALFIISGGFNTDGPEDAICLSTDDALRTISQFAQTTGGTGFLLRQIPNQPIFFTDNPGESRVEDQIIAKTQRYYTEMVFDNPDVIALLPMTKAAKVAVDAVIEYTSFIQPLLTIEKVMATGYSKRGWTAWLLAATDPRVFAIAPTVYDLGNSYESLHHHNQAYGGWSYAFSPYYNENVTKDLDHPRAIAMFEEIGIDYMAYNPRLTIPKVLLHATGDEFFLPDDMHYFFSELAAPKYILSLENEDHVAANHYDRINNELFTFFVASANLTYQWPQLTWSFTEGATDASVTLVSNPAPLNITAWWADTQDRTCNVDPSGVCRRDFRLQTLIPPGDNPVVWTATNPINNGDGSFTITVDKVAPGFRGVFLSMSYAGVREGDVIDFTTEINIVPDILPYPRCTTPEECYGYLV